jgi:hypothetical protein
LYGRRVPTVLDHTGPSPDGGARGCVDAWRNRRPARP